MSHTSNFLKLQLRHELSPTETQIHFDRVAITALKECQSMVDRYQERLDEVVRLTQNTAILHIDAKHFVRQNPESVGCTRIDTFSDDVKEATLAEQVKRGNRLFTFRACPHPSAKFVTGMSLFFVPQHITDEELAERGIKALTQNHERKLQEAEQGLKTAKDDMRTLKKAILARQAEIKPLSKILAEF